MEAMTRNSRDKPSRGLASEPSLPPKHMHTQAELFRPPCGCSGGGKGEGCIGGGYCRCNPRYDLRAPLSLRLC